ncbi:hypothetical protein IAQ61_005138 [Plenodomus lingam]|uniref:uncharacterized protein n=1 Tax=Leptosphaeria maculans TaxID=5022 RepID=UPI00332F5555|nr:hypothetical protein IAQ61_005138 [Plenodomus lingam]
MRVSLPDSEILFTKRSDGNTDQAVTLSEDSQHFMNSFLLIFTARTEKLSALSERLLPTLLTDYHHLAAQDPHRDLYLG